MGRPYAREVDEFGLTYSHALDTPIDRLTDFVSTAARTPLYAVGSGGSLTASVLASTMHEEVGFMAKYITPLEFLNSRIARDASILVISAGGNNRDILSAFDKAVATEPTNLGILCASTDNRLTRKAELLPRVFLCRGTTPKKDGFLATNSLVAMSVWLARAYAATTPLMVDLPDSLDKLPHLSMNEQDSKSALEERMAALAGRSTIVVLYDIIGKAAAVDLESKLVEAGLNNVQLSDYRNFAHGRHNWIGKNPDSTGVVFFTSPECRSLAAKTVRLMPDNVPAVEIGTERSGPVGMLSLLIQAMHAVKMFGDFRGIDPGRPGVAEFGRRIYHIRTPVTKAKTTLGETAVRRKFGAIINGTRKTRQAALKQFLRRMEQTSFDAIVFDYDGTLCDAPNRRGSPSPETADMLATLVKNGIPVGVATGRGRSIRDVLREIVPKRSWHGVFVGYYNCADVATLDADGMPDVDSATDPALASFASHLVENCIVPKEAMEERPNQISLLSGNLTAMDLIREINILHPQALGSVKIVESGRSVDILPARVSKTAILEAIKETLGCENVLCIGDQGLWPGNDFELLSTPFSLSVDKTSWDPDSCWNLAPPGYVGERASRYYFDLMSMRNKKIQIKCMQEYL